MWNTVASFLIPDWWFLTVKALLPCTHKGEHTNDGCCQGSSPHSGVSEVQEWLEGGWELLWTVRVLPVINLLVCMCMQLREQQKRRWFHDGVWPSLRCVCEQKTDKAVAWGWERNVVLLLFIPAIYDNSRAVLVPFSPVTVCSAGSGCRFGDLFLLIFCFSVYGGYHQ